MLAGGVLDQPVVVVSEGFNALARPLVGIKRYEQVFAVLDGDGQVIGQVEPTFRDRGWDKVFRTLFSIVLGGSTRRNVLDYRLLDKFGSTVLEVEIRGSVLYVKIPERGLVGAVSNRSVPRRLEARFYAEAPAKKLFQKDPDVIATLHDVVDRPPFEYELKDARGTVFARVTNREDRLNRLELLDRSDPRLATLALGFACGLVDRIWLQIPIQPDNG